MLFGVEGDLRVEERVVNKSNGGDGGIIVESVRFFVVNIIMGYLMKERKGFLILMEMLGYMFSV